MTKVTLEIHDDVISALNKIRNINDSGIELEVPAGSVLFENILNIKLIKEFSQKNGVTVEIETEDENGLAMLENTEGNTTGFSTNTLPNESIHEETVYERPTKKITFKFPKLPSLNFGGGLKLIIPAIIIALVVGGYVYAGNNLPKANVKINVKSLPLTRSVTVKVKADTPTDATQKILRGTKVTTSVQDTLEGTATGEKVVGQKASGTVTVYNKTSDSVKIKKGTYLTSDKGYKFVTDDDVTVDAKVVTPDPAGIQPDTVAYGNASVDVTADAVGDTYNLKKAVTFTIKGYKSSEMVASAKDDFKGGSSKKVTVVSDVDQKNLSDKLKEQLIQKASTDIQNKMGAGQKLIKGTVTAQITDESFNKKIGDETTTFSVTQTANATALAYFNSELTSLTDKASTETIPAGFELSDMDKQIGVEVLGNSSTGTEADLQITMKTFVITKIDKEALTKKLAGKSAAEATKIVGGIQEINNYEVSISPRMMFFGNIPKDEKKIFIEVVRQ